MSVRVELRKKIASIVGTHRAIAELAAMKKGTGIKVIVSMIGLDGHTTGGEVISILLRNAGFEVVYLGVNQTPEMIINAAVQEDVDAIGISSHAANYSQIEELVDLVKKNDLSDVPVICGGNIPPRQIEKLLANGVAKVFIPGSKGEEIVDYLVSNSRGANAGLAAKTSQAG